MHIGTYLVFPPVIGASEPLRTRRRCWIYVDRDDFGAQIPRLSAVGSRRVSPWLRCADTLPPRRLFSFITFLTVRLDASPRSQDLSFFLIFKCFCDFSLYHPCQRARLNSHTQLDAQIIKKNRRQTRLRLRLFPPLICPVCVPAASQHPRMLKTKFLLQACVRGMFIKPTINNK